jgi:hypothetical protein
MPRYRYAVSDLVIIRSGSVKLDRYNSPVHAEPPDDFFTVMVTGRMKHSGWCFDTSRDIKS